MVAISDFIDMKHIIAELIPSGMPRLDDLRLQNVRKGGIRPDAVLASEMRYPRPTELPMGAENAHGELEMLGDVTATHWYAEADGITWHFVTTGDPNNEALVIVPGFPETWYAFHNQMRDLSDQFYCIGVDVIGNGQSDKRVDLDYRYPAIAAALAKLLHAIGVDRFNLGSHDRGTVVADHLLNVDGMSARVMRFVRMQQSANEPHGEPTPPHKLMGSSLMTPLLRWKGFPRVLYAHSIHRVAGITPEVLDRLDHEFKFKGVAEACPLQFRTTSFEQELEDRHAFLFENMTMPVLFLQGRNDPGQHPEEYRETPNFVTQGRVEFIDGSHFFHLGAPDAATSAIRRFLSEPLP